MAETPAVMPQLHMPLQSGSDRILKAMRRSYRSEKFLGILDRVRDRMPNAAITTDIIVGFPGETDEDFEETMRVVEQSRFSSAFTFQYSIREGTPAATMPDQVPKAVVQERYNRLIALQERISLEENQAQLGREVEVLVSMGEGKKDAETHRLTGRAEDNRLVHFEVPAGSDIPRPGDVVSVAITHAAPFHLLADADGAPLRIRRTRAGDAWDRTQAESCAIPGAGRRSTAGRAAGGLARTAHAARRGVTSDGARTGSELGARLYAVVGATGTGKSALSLDLAEALAARGRPAEIVNADAMQLYRGMDIGTAKLPVTERRGIPHHLLDVLDVTDDAAVAWYQERRAQPRSTRSTRAGPTRSSSAARGSTCRACSSTSASRRATRRSARELEAELERDGPGVALRTAARRRSGHGRARRSAQRAADRPGARGARAGRSDPRRRAPGRAGACGMPHDASSG